MNQTEWFYGLLDSRGLPKDSRGLPRSDGRPLFRYRLEPEELNRTEEFVRQMVSGVLVGRRYRDFEPLFCLYAAETFRREHTGGPWAWEAIFRPLGASVPDQQRIAHWVQAGLQ
jgi:hypothetical protein